MVDKYRVNNKQLQLNLNSVSNPINAFKMIKRLTNEWSDLENRMRSDSVTEFLENLSNLGQTKFPEEVSFYLIYNIKCPKNNVSFY